MQANHTPGPWWLDDDGFVASGSGDTYTTVADPHCGDRDIDERESNARLIAAAPELLDALVSLLNVEGAALHGARLPGFVGLDVAYHFEAARAAIARATGVDHA